MRTCPRCRRDFAQAKKRGPMKVCPHCGQGIYYDKKTTVTHDEGIAIEQEKTMAITIVEVFEKLASRARGALFEFVGKAKSDELAKARLFIQRCRKYICKTPLCDKVSARDFALRLVKFTFNDERHAFTAQNAKSVTWLMGKEWASLSSNLLKIMITEQEEKTRSTMPRHSLVSGEELRYGVI